STKGKLAYMSPEHALNHPLDRRADIFALGTVLWELTVGRRLFKGENDAATLMRITSGKAIHPSQVVSDYPPELERIVLRALAHDRTQRYPTAAAFARDLDRFVSNSGTPAGPPELSALMHQLFGDRIAAKDALLRADRVSETKASIALGVIDRREDDGSGSDAMPREQSHSSVVTRTPSPRALPTERRWPIVALGLIALAAIAGVAAMVLPNDPTGSLRVASTPSGARVRVGEEVVGTTPVTVEGLAIGRHPITLELPGYDPFSASVDVESGRTELNYRLVARVSGPTTTDPPPTPTPVVNEDSTVEEPVDEARVEDAPATITPTITPEPAPTPIDPPEPEPEDEEVEVEEPTPSVADRTPTVRRPPPPPAGPPAYLNLITSPWAEVRINGRDAGRTPLVRRSVPSGRIVIRMRAEGQGPWRTERVNAAPGETVSRRFDL
ncbi:MAG: PEGA domain-containing protein, partial [Sandaracinaceae bacterium]